MERVVSGFRNQWLPLPLPLDQDEETRVPVQVRTARCRPWHLGILASLPPFRTASTANLLWLGLCLHFSLQISLPFAAVLATVQRMYTICAAQIACPFFCPSLRVDGRYKVPGVASVSLIWVVVTALLLLTLPSREKKPHIVFPSCLHLLQKLKTTGPGRIFDLSTFLQMNSQVVCF
ncbi:hypothetical protein B0T16DRAFT_109915 [Cercophora newfieldiana]|uniref:Uncharacterized protein n=1 Tax=Cercophora newfieldiana TaxID=92897 RepID=A0AA40CVK2_9PEZI|nr:hypothetical protein B0T16DRAFT_109915 [Cercophora newfieldiana]